MAAGECSSGEPAPGIGPGRVVLIVGPSGAGKDAILREVRARLADDGRFLFPRRVVTRAASAAEDHDTLPQEAFKERLARGGFALHWHAHGLWYGIPAEIDDAVRSRRIVVFNASREVVAMARRRFAATAAVLVDAPIAVRAARLAERNRESEDDVLSRLNRAVAGFSAADADLVIDNSGTLDDAAARLVGWLRAIQAASA